MNVLCQVIVKLAERHPQIGPAQKLKTGRQNAHDGIALVVQSDTAANNACIAAKPTHPKAMPQDDDWRTAGAVLLGNERTARNDAYSQHGKKVRTGIPHQHALRIALSCEIEAL